MTIDVSEIGENIRKARVARILTSGSIILAILYVMAFIYAKTYLAVFGFQVELSSLSLIDLLLLHRYFLGHHFFVLSGVLQAHLLYEFRWIGIREHKVSSLIAFVAPLLILGIAYGAAIWSEADVPKGFNITAPGVPLAFVSGWMGGGVAYWIGRLAVRRPTSIRDATWIIGAVATLLLVAATYRLFSDAVARDRRSRHDFQAMVNIQTEGQTLSGPCYLIHIDSQGLYLDCSGVHHVVNREKLRAFQIVTPQVKRRESKVNR